MAEDNPISARRVLRRLRRYATVSLMTAVWLMAMLGGVRAGDELRVITSGNYPPFVYTGSDGTLTGFEIDFANALCAVLAMRCVFADLPFEKTIPALIAGKGDAIVASLSITEERKKLVAFTDRYYRTPIQFVAATGFDRPVSPRGLKGFRIGVAHDTTSEAYLRNRFADQVAIVPFAAQSEVNRALLEGHVDLVLADSFAMWQFVKSEDGRRFAPVGGPVYVDEGIGIAVRLRDETLRQRLNLAIARIRLDGTYQKINAKYFPFSIY
jgi:arginine/ornithine transport system substrate-binding protein